MKPSIVVELSSDDDYDVPKVKRRHRPSAYFSESDNDEEFESESNVNCKTKEDNKSHNLDKICKPPLPITFKKIKSIKNHKTKCNKPIMENKIDKATIVAHDKTYSTELSKEFQVLNNNKENTKSRIGDPNLKINNKATVNTPNAINLEHTTQQFVQDRGPQSDTDLSTQTTQLLNFACNCERISNQFNLEKGKTVNLETLNVFKLLLNNIRNATHYSHLVQNEYKIIDSFLVLRTDYQFLLYKLYTLEDRWRNIVEFVKLIKLDLEEEDICIMYDALLSNNFITKDNLLITSNLLILFTK